MSEASEARADPVDRPERRVVLVVPTYDNAGTLEDVLRRALATGHPVIVVDDGSTDDTPGILARVGGPTVLSHGENRGKGAALRTGLHAAHAAGYTHAITLDSDGQHRPEDVPRFVAALEEDPEALLVGARDLVRAGAGRGSRWGGAFSNFWCALVSGQRLPDTQSGFRAYPLESVCALALRLRGFAFEIEVLVRAAWTGVRLRAVPVEVHYAQGAERVSHFRPLRDFMRIGLLYTHLCFLRIALPAPYLALLSRADFRRLGPGERLRASVRSLLLEGHGSRVRMAASVGLGLFMGLTPLWGFQVPLTLALAHALRLSKAIAVLAAHVSFPLAIPAILYASLVLGRWILGAEDGPVTSLELERADWGHWIVGSFALATLAGSAGFLLAWILLAGARRSIDAWKGA